MQRVNTYRRSQNAVGTHRRRTKSGKVVTVKSFTRSGATVSNYSRKPKGKGIKIRTASGKQVYKKRSE
jgi:hypothetical protein